MVETMRYAYADRAHLLGDPDFVKAPIAGLLSKRYAATLRAQHRPRSARRRRTRSAPPIRRRFEGNNTTHFSIVDRFGNAVANTYTLNLSYGVGLIAEGTGVLLNNELDDFAAAPGAPNAFGLVGYEANEPGPNKRPLSSMTPTIVLRNGKPLHRHRLAGRQPHHHRGAAGAAQRDRLPHDARGGGAGAAHPSSVAAGRDDGRAGASPATMKALEARGHNVTIWPPFTSVHSIMVTPEGLIGAADTRTRGALAAGY